MTNQHPITPPPELVEQWYDAISGDLTDWKQRLATQAAQWGADRELEACVEWFDNQSLVYHRDLEYALRTARRPKPPNLKELALERCNDYIDPDGIIRRALEALDD